MFKVKGKRIDLRTPAIEDAEDIIRYIGDYEVNKWLINVPYPYTRKDFIYYLRHIVRKGMRKKTDYCFCIHEKKLDEVIGGVGIHKVDRKHGLAEMGYWLARAHWRKGYATEAIDLSLRFAFRRLKLRKVYLLIYGGNKGSAALAEKAGFKLEGTLRKHRIMFGKVHDELRYGLLREEYEAKS
jgi:RimJ/RimL family protein N-acetyltransferase